MKMKHSQSQYFKKATINDEDEDNAETLVSEQIS